MEGLTKEHKHDRKARLAALGPAFSLCRGDDRLWSLQKLSVQGYSAGLMDTGHDARALQSEGLFLLGGHHCVPLTEF